MRRRGFLKFAAVLAASAVAEKQLGALVPSTAGANVTAFRTSTHERFAPVDVGAWKPGAATDAISIRIDPVQRYQELLGFGAAMTDASCYLLQQASPEKRAAILNDCFGKDGLRFSVARTCIGSSDYSLNAYTFDDTDAPDPQLEHFSIDHDRKYILPALMEAQRVNPDLFYFSSPWTPPAWMKAGNTLLGGSMRQHYFAAYADYFVKFLQEYAKAGVKVQAVTVQNETDTDQDGRMPQALWGQEYEMEFVKRHLGPALQKAGLDTKIWIIDHNYSLWGRAVDELSDPAVYKYVDGIAWHGYVGTPDAMTRVHAMFPEKHAYWTEGGPDISAPDYATDWARWSGTFTGILRNCARCIVSWNLVLDEKGKPNIGPFSCGGLVTLDSRSQEVRRSGQYWAFAHYSKLMERGARIIATNGDVFGVHHVAAENADGGRVLVLTNTAASDQRVQCLLEDAALDVHLPANSVTSLTWS